MQAVQAFCLSRAGRTASLVLWSVWAGAPHAPDCLLCPCPLSSGTCGAGLWAGMLLPSVTNSSSTPPLGGTGSSLARTGTAMPGALQAPGLAWSRSISSQLLWWNLCVLSRGNLSSAVKSGDSLAWGPCFLQECCGGCRAEPAPGTSEHECQCEQCPDPTQHWGVSHSSVWCSCAPFWEALGWFWGNPLAHSQVSDLWSPQLWRGQGGICRNTFYLVETAKET